MTEENDNLFQKALELNEPDREAFLVGLPGEQRAELEALLAADAAVQEGNFLEPESTVIKKVHIDDVPKQIGPYKILQHIGDGGMGSVFMAEQKSPIRRRVAIKIIKSNSPSKEIIARFEAERQALAMMDHQNIAKVLDAGITEDKLPYFAMEYVKGISLTEYCDNNRLTSNERLELFVQICRAIQHAHQKGIIHRDIKPSNVLVALYDGKPMIKVIDFGLAKALQGQLMLTEKTLFTEHNAAVGTWQYMSPEQAEMNNLDVDTRTDIYSLGVVLFELLTGSTPLTPKQITGAELLARVKLVKEEEAPRPSVRLSDSGDAATTISAQRKTDVRQLSNLLKGELDWIAMKALDKDRTRRYESVGGFADDVMRYLKDEAIEARPPSLVYQLQKSFRKHRGAFVSGLLIFGLLIAGLISTGTMWYRASHAEAMARVAADNAKESEADALTSRAKALTAKEAAEKERDRADLQFNIASESDAAVKFQLAIARWDANRVGEARQLLQEIPHKHRNKIEWHYCNRHFLGSDLTLYGHGGSVHSACFSPDDSLVVSAGADKSVRLWDARSGHALRTFNGHASEVTSVCFSSDGQRIASGSWDRTVQWWNIETGEELLNLKGHTSAVLSVSFSPDGTRFASGSQDHTVKIWDAELGSELLTLEGHTSSVHGVCFSPDSTRVVSASADKTLKLWDALTGREIRTMKGHTAIAMDVCFSPDGAAIASAGWDQTAKLWDCKTGRELLTLEGHGDVVESIQFSPDGATIITAGRDRTARLWDTKSGRETLVLKGHQSSVNSARYSRNGTRIVSASDDQTVKVWDATTDVEFVTLKGHTSSVADVCFSPDSAKVASASWDGDVKLWTSNTGLEYTTLKGDSSSRTCVCFSPNGRRVVSGSWDRTVKIWDVETGKELSVLRGHTSSIHSVAASACGTRIASGAADATVRIWDALSGRELFVLTGHESSVNSVCFSPDSTKISSASSDHTVKLWDANSGLELVTIKGHVSPVTSVCFSPDGATIASGADDHTVRLWDSDTGLPILTLKGHTHSVNCVAFSPKGDRIASGGNGSILKLWDAKTGQELLAFEGIGAPLTSVCFSPDGTKIVAGSKDENVKLWRIPTAIEFHILYGHSSPVTEVSFSSDGTRIYSKSSNERIVWDSGTGRRLADGKWMSLRSYRRNSPDGRWFVVPVDDDVILVDREFERIPSEHMRRESKARPDPWWHNQRALSSAKEADWYAATFHAGHLMLLQPNSEDAYDLLHSSWNELDSAKQGLLPCTVVEALALPVP